MGTALCISQFLPFSTARVKSQGNSLSHCLISLVGRCYAFRSHYNQSVPSQEEVVRCSEPSWHYIFYYQPWLFTRNLPWASKSWTSMENTITSISPLQPSQWTTGLAAHWALRAILQWRPRKNTTLDLHTLFPHSISILQLAPPLSGTSRNPRSTSEPKNKTLKLHHPHFHPQKPLGIAKYGRASSNSRRGLLQWREVRDAARWAGWPRHRRFGSSFSLPSWSLAPPSGSALGSPRLWELVSGKITIRRTRLVVDRDDIGWSIGMSSEDESLPAMSYKLWSADRSFSHTPSVIILLLPSSLPRF